MNKKSAHLSWADIIEAKDGIASQDKLDHLAECEECRDNRRQMQELQLLFPQDGGSTINNPDCLDDEKIAAFIDDTLSASEKDQARRHIAKCESCFFRSAQTHKSCEDLKAKKSALAATPDWLLEKALALDKGFSREQTLVIKEGKTIPLLSRLKKGLASPVPAYALAGIFLFVLLIRQKTVRPLAFYKSEPDRNGAKVICLPETTSFSVFRETAVNLRGTNAGSYPVLDETQVVSQEPDFNGLTVIEKLGSGLIFTWPKIEGNREYLFKLDTLGDQGNRIMLSVVAKAEKFEYSFEKYGYPAPNRLHKWEIIGRYGDGLFFKAQNDFILVK